MRKELVKIDMPACRIKVSKSDVLGFTMLQMLEDHQL